MNTTLEAPLKMKGRDQARAAIAQLDCSVGQGDEVVVRFQSGALPTTSFLAQIIGTLAVEQGARIVFENLVEWAQEIVVEYAAAYEISDLISLR